MRISFLFVILISCHFCFAQISSVTVQVSGLTCPVCSRTVQKSLEKIPFVSSVNPDFKTQQYQLKLNGNNINLELIKKQIEDAGFSVAGLQLTASIEGMNLEKNKVIKLRDIEFRFIGSNEKWVKGERTLKLIEKDFLSAKSFSKYCSGTPNCSAKEMSPDGNRIYRVI